MRDTAYVALLRAVNVGGTGKLAMADLHAACAAAGFQHAQTYIASGNVVFTSPLGEADVQEALARALRPYVAKPVAALVRTAAELQAAIAANPFADAAGNRAMVVFLNNPPPADTLERVRHLVDEHVALGRREIYIRYTEGMRDSKLQVPAAAAGTARNLNTCVKLAALAAALPVP